MLCALVGDLLLAQDPLRSQLALRLRPPAWLPGADPRFPLGTDPLGRDLLGRVVLGARLSLVVGGATTLLAMVLGVGPGLVAGYYRGRVDGLISTFRGPRDHHRSGGARSSVRFGDAPGPVIRCRPRVGALPC